MQPLRPEGIVAIGKFMEESLHAGTVIANGWLPPTCTRLQLVDGEVSASDGPFIEGKELIPSFVVIDVPTREEAIAWANRFLNMGSRGELRLAEIRAPG